MNEQPTEQKKRFRSYSAAQMFKDLIMEGGRTDEQIHALVRAKFNFENDSRIPQVGWYRTALRREGLSPPDRIPPSPVEVKPMRYSSGQCIKDLIMLGLYTDEDIFEKAAGFYNLPEDRFYYVEWYRNQLKKVGVTVPSKVVGGTRHRNPKPIEVDLPEEFDIPGFGVAPNPPSVAN